jgi:hypothetical protein
MSVPRSAWRNVIAMLAAVTGGTPETVAIDFGLGFGEGIEIASGKFGLRLASNVLTTARVQAHAELSLHVETGSLEDPLGPSDSFELNSEVIAAAILLVDSDDNALSELSTYTWTPGPEFNFVQELGEPLLLAQNPTFRVDALTSNTSVSAGHVRFWYRYVSLSDQELLRLFALRR